MIDIENELKNKDFLKILFLLSVFSLFIGSLILLIILTIDQITTIQQDFIVTKVSGKVTLKRGNSYLVEIKNQMILRKNDIINTDKNSFIDISLGDKGAIRIKQNSIVKLDSKSKIKPIELYLYFGELLSKIVSHKKKNEMYIIKTNTCNAGVRGTSFILSYHPPETQLFVKEGKVALTNNFIKTIEVDGGYKLELSGEQAYSLIKLSKDDEIKLHEIENIKSELNKKELKNIFISKTKNDINEKFERQFQNLKNTLTGKNRKNNESENIDEKNIEDSSNKEGLKYTLTVVVYPRPRGDLKAGIIDVLGDKYDSFCNKKFEPGSYVKLIAEPIAPFVFENWQSSDSIIANSESIELKMDSNKKIFATFGIQ